MEPITQPRREKDLVRRGVIYLFVGAGLSVFLSATHTWFYGWFTTAVALLADSASVLAVIIGLADREHPSRTSAPLARRILHLLAWATLLLLYVSVSGCPHFLRTSTAHDARFDRCFREVFLFWFVWLLVGGRLFAQLLGMSWYRLKIYNVLTIGKDERTQQLNER